MKNGLHKALLTRIEAISEEYLALHDATEKRELILTVCKSIAGEYEPEVVLNVENLVNYCFSDFAPDFEDLLEFLRVNGHLDRQTFIREARDDFDNKFGTITSPILTQYEIPEAVSMYRIHNSGRYHPSPISSVNAALERLQEYKIEYQDYTFVDVGSGMGRNLLLASNFPFKRVVGIEQSEYLNKIAKTNVSKYQLGRTVCLFIDLQCVDALEYQFLDESAVFYFWRPFSDEVAEKFLSRVEEYYKSMSLRVFLIFLGTVYPVMSRLPLFKVLDVFHTSDLSFGENEYFTVSIYSN